MIALLRRVAPAIILALGVSSAGGQSSLPSRLTDKAFWSLFATMSEEGGSFPSENFISNERTYQHPIPYLQRMVRAGDVYLGVGPEQNFTYIANLKPGFAVIFDIRRQNALAHLMYKALFELSPTRAEFLARLFSRRLPDSVTSKSNPSAEELFAALAAAPSNDSLFQRNLNEIYDRLTKTHGFALDSVDLRSIRHVYLTFFEAGTDINYNYRPGFAGLSPVYPTLGELQALTNASGDRMAFLADEARYQLVRSMEQRNLIVPVVGDFAGPKAIRAVGTWLKERGANVGAFYLSNVEQYLFRSSFDASRFYENVATLPTDTTSMFIRSVPPQGPLMSMNAVPVAPQISYSVQVFDSANVSVISVTKDSAGQRVTTRTIDSSANRPMSPLPVFRSLQPSPLTLSPRFMMGGTLFSGVAPIGQTLNAYRAGTLDSYNAAIAMTKVDGWK
ncbi:MAG TPA: hypothetical protein VGP95_01715 [Gemmatimonadaceae bacterium]|jgi:hypothetical protein|nr:hypothetical protein [Gemmatimonadaceae bacterium]